MQQDTENGPHQLLLVQYYNPYRIAQISPSTYVNEVFQVSPVQILEDDLLGQVVHRDHIVDEWGCILPFHFYQLLLQTFGQNFEMRTRKKFEFG